MTNEALNRAGTALLHASILQAKCAKRKGGSKLNKFDYQKLLAVARENLEQADPLLERHRYLAVKITLEGLEAIERGDNPLSTSDFFSGCVEAILGGPRSLDLGGKIIKNRPTVEGSYMRAAVYLLWNRDFDRDQLVLDAQSLGYFTNRKKLRNFVNNSTNQKPDGSGKPQSTIWAHIPLIEDLVNNHGYRALSDFKIDAIHDHYLV